VEFVVENNRTTIRLAWSPENPFLKYVGALPTFFEIHEMNAWIGMLRDEETEIERQSIPTYSPPLV
jgi:hypothetical protein